MSEFVLDASALLALLNEEAGAGRVREVLDRSVIGSVNLCEVVGKLVATGIDPRVASSIVESLGVPVVDFDRQTAHAAGALIAETRKRGLSLGDRACLALGIKLQRTTLTADREWLDLNLGVRIEAIRSSPTTAREGKRRRKGH